MSAVKHTPGPWSHREWEPDGPLSDSVQSLAPNAGDGDIICLSPGYGRFEESALRWEANARLIAQSPALHAIAERIDTYLGMAGEPAEEGSNNPLRDLRFEVQRVLSEIAGGSP